MRRWTEILKQAFRPPLLWVTLIIPVASLVMVRLGFWQLGRMYQKRAQNEAIQRQLNAPALRLNATLPEGQPEAWRFRHAQVRGTYDYDREFAVLNKLYRGRTGLWLVTPLRIAGQPKTILVVRGWLPFDKQDPAEWADYRVPNPVEVSGYLMPPEKPPSGKAEPPRSQGFPRHWYWMDVDAIAPHLPYPVVSVYLIALPQSPDAHPQLLREPLQLSLDEGPHLGYAVQWFLFALALPVGYLIWLMRQRPHASPAQTHAP